MNALLSGSKGKIPLVIHRISLCIRLVANELQLYFNICWETCFIISCKQRKPFVFVAFVSVDNNKFLSLFLLGVHINVGVIFLMQAANRLGMRLLKLVLLFVHHFRFVKSG